MSGLLGQGQLGSLILAGDEESSSYVFAQAQALIIQNKVWGQAQASIYQDKRWGQAQALISTVQIIETVQNSSEHGVTVSITFSSLTAGNVVIIEVGKKDNPGLTAPTQTVGPTLTLLDSHRARSDFGGTGFFFYRHIQAGDSTTFTFDSQNDKAVIGVQVSGLNILSGPVVNAGTSDNSGTVMTLPFTGSDLWVNFGGFVTRLLGDGVITPNASSKVIGTQAPGSGSHDKIALLYGYWNLTLGATQSGGSEFFWGAGGASWAMLTAFKGYGQAQAKISTGFTGAHGQAQAYLLGNAYGQSQADIKQTYQGYSQAQSQIKQTYQGYAQAQATIIGWAFGQAQGDIKQVYQGYGQSQADILQTYFGFAQAQALIGTNNYGFGQAQGRILQVYFGFAQGQADILQVYFAFAQAQGDIKQTYQGYAQAQGYVQPYSFGQAQGDILQTYQGYGQAQAEIKQTYQGYAQAQGYIQARGYGQAQGSILQTYQGYAQAQADINQTYQGYGQAQGSIGTNTYGFGQAQAQISTRRVHGQSQGYIKVIGRGYAQAQATVTTTRVHGQAQGTILNPYVWAQARSRVWYNNQRGYAQAQAVIRSGYFGQAQALIDSSIKFAFAQAQAFIGCSEDTFTRTTSYGLGSDYTWVEYDTSFDVQEDSTYHVDGTQVINNPDNFDWDSYQLNRPVPLTGSVQFEFTTNNSAFADFSWIAVVFGEDYQDDHLSIAITEVDVGQWELTGEWASAGPPSVSVTIEENKTYRVKMSYTEAGFFRAKVWDITDIEPDWLLSYQFPTFIPSNIAWLDFYFAQDIIAFDNLEFCPDTPGPIVTTSHGQAQALITRTQGYGQANAGITNTKANGCAQALIAWTSVSNGFRDTFTRTTNRHLGAPHYNWSNIYSSVDHPAATTVRVNGSAIEIPAGIRDSYYLGYTFGRYQLVEFDFTNTTTDPFRVELVIPGSPEFTIAAFIDPDIAPGFIGFATYIDGSGAGSTGAAAQTASWKLSTVISPTLATTTIYRDGVLLTAFNSLPPGDHFGNTNLLIKLKGQTPTGSLTFDNLILEKGFYKHGQARARIIRVANKVHGQAQARIKKTTNAYAQAQAIINQGYGVAQAEAVIDIYLAKYGQAQAIIKVIGRGFGQSQGLITSDRWKWAQAQAYIFKSQGLAQAQALLRGIGKKVGQAQALIVGTRAYGQAQAQIKRTISSGQAQAFILQTQAGNLVRYNEYLLPGYLQEETLESPMRINMVGAPYMEPSAEYIGLENKILSLRLLVIQGTYQAAKEKVLLAGSLVRTNRGDFERLSIMDNTKYYLAKTKSIKLSQTAGLRENAAEYTLEFEVKPWLYSNTYYTLTGTTLLDTNSLGRVIGNGTWTPATIIISGTDVTVSGYTQTGEFTGFLSVNGTVNNMILDSENYTVTMAGENRNDLLNTVDHKIMVGPGRTLFAVNGATSCEIIYQDRWPL